MNDEPENTKRLRTDARNLSCELTEDERNERARTLVDELGAKHKTEQRHKEQKVAMKAELTEHDSKIDRLRAAVATGNETRLVTVDDVADYERGVVDTIRRDTGAVVRSRPLKEDERQTTMLDEGETDAQDDESDESDAPDDGEDW